MPDPAGPRALYRLCDSLSGVNWRPTKFEDELTLSHYACCVCHVIPSTTVLLPCSHSLCEHCVTGCVVRDGDSVCPLDAKPFREDECQKIKLPARTKHNLKAHCWNEADGCRFVGTIEAILQHFDEDCAFHALQCRRCEERVLRTGIAAHHVAGCSLDADTASGAQQNLQDSSSTSCYENATLGICSALGSQVYGLSTNSEHGFFDNIIRAGNALERSCLRGIKSMESDIISMIAQQMKAGLEEVKMLVRDLLSDQLSSLQSQINELVEQSRHHDTCNMQEVVHEIRDSQSELKQDVRAQSKLIGRMLKDVETKFKESHTTQVHELIHALKGTEREIKKEVSKVEANISKQLTEHELSRQKELCSSDQNSKSTERARPLVTSALGKEDLPLNTQEGLIPLKLEMLVHETLITLEFLRQEIYRQHDEPWVSNITSLWGTYDDIWTNVSQSRSFWLTLNNAAEIFKRKEYAFTVVNVAVYRDMHIRLTFISSRLSTPKLLVDVECIKTLGDSRFPFTKIAIDALEERTGETFLFALCCQKECETCPDKNISHFLARFEVKEEMLDKQRFMKDGKLSLEIHFD